MDLELIRRLSRSETKTQYERFLKLSEECGELAQEILIRGQASGFHHKSAGSDGITGEAVDVVLVALSIFYHQGGTPEELYAISAKKCQKWQESQEKHQAK